MSGICRIWTLIYTIVFALGVMTSQAGVDAAPDTAARLVPASAEINSHTAFNAPHTSDSSLNPSPGKVIAIADSPLVHADLGKHSAMELQLPPAASPTSFGTAWPLENGYVVTNYHVIAGASELALQRADGRQLKAKPVICDQANDLALLAVEDVCELPPALPLCRSVAPPGTSVFTLGFPRVDVLGYSPKFTEGLIASDLHSLGNQARYLTTIDIQPGNSGGPLLNIEGEVVGVVAAMMGMRDEATGSVQILPSQSSAIKITSLYRLMAQLPDDGLQNRPLASQGLSLDALCDQLKASVLVVIVRGGTS